MHQSVLLKEAIDFLNLKKGDVVYDATLGAGGHSEKILEMVGETGKLLAIDKDSAALALAEKRLRGNVCFVQGDFRDIERIATKSKFEKANGIIVDLGVSSMQFDEGERGFSFKGHHILDMRMDKTQKLTAAEIVNTFEEHDLEYLFREYGEEQFARPIAKEIVKLRVKEQIIWTDQLAEVARRVYRAQGARSYKSLVTSHKSLKDPATKIFQSLRIKVNEELMALESALPQMIGLLAPKGRLAVISFHSLEDRIVKEYFRKEAKGCVCPPEFPKCVCGFKPRLKIITRKPITPTEEEIRENPRSRSAKMRVAEKLN